MIHVEEIGPRHRAKKDKRNWCKGKIGVEHDYQVSDETRQLNSQHYPSRIFHTLWIRCAGCGRKKDYLGLFVNDEPWILRRRKEWQVRVDELAHRNKGEAPAH